jgi:uncharacterized protein (TIGR02284 family)
VRTHETVRTLNRLIRTCRDAEDLCTSLASTTGSAGVAAQLRDRGEEWARRGDELQALVLLLDGEPETQASPTAPLRRAWLHLKAVALSATDVPALDAWQRMQQQAATIYEEALDSYLPARIRRTVGLQADRIGDQPGHRAPARGQYALHRYRA